MLVSFFMVFGSKRGILNMGSFILRGEIWTKIQLQVSLMMVHISVSGIAGKHDNDSLRANVVVIIY